MVPTCQRLGVGRVVPRGGWASSGMLRAGSGRPEDPLLTGKVRLSVALAGAVVGQSWKEKLS